MKLPVNVCPDCGSPDIEISLPTWYRCNGLTFVETDVEASAICYWCPQCETHPEAPREIDPDTLINVVTLQ